MQIATASYAKQLPSWPQSGRQILASFDHETVLVYQAYSPAIGNFAARNAYFGGEFKYSRMSWIKPNFLWMMYRSNWGRSPGQEVVVAVRLRRPFFDALLDQGVPSSYTPGVYPNETEWRAAIERSDVRLQWDPDHLPTGDKCERRAIQLGLRGGILDAYGRREIVEILDVSEFVAEQRANVENWKCGELFTPVESVYVPADTSLARRLGLDS